MSEQMMASDLVAKIHGLIAEHGDKPVLVAIADDGAYPVAEPRLDSDGDGDECFLI